MIPASSYGSGLTPDMNRGVAPGFKFFYWLNIFIPLKNI